MKKYLLTMLGVLVLAVWANTVWANGNHDKNSHHDGDSHSENSVVNSTNKNANNNRSFARQRQDQGQLQGQKQGTSVSVDDNSTYKATDGRDWAPQVNAPALTTGVCMGSASGGISGPGIGLSFGATTVDEECQIRYNSIRLEQLGLATPAMLIMCQIPTARLALQQAGNICPDVVRKVATPVSRAPFGGK